MELGGKSDGRDGENMEWRGGEVDLIKIYFCMFV